ncbi:MAG: NHL repeat-containing protein [Candidatus Woesearchaeota archaeon]|nr:NHL repeat-containing protein [Candidatus Woesearchaeota archaeon]
MIKKIEMHKMRKRDLWMAAPLIILLLFIELSIAECSKSEGTDPNSEYPLRFFAGVCTDNIGAHPDEIIEKEGKYYLAEQVCNISSGLCTDYFDINGAYGGSVISGRNALSCSYDLPEKGLSEEEKKGSAENFTVKIGEIEYQSARCCRNENSVCTDSSENRTDLRACCAGFSCISGKCAKIPECIPSSELCSDGIDNDCDGKVDCDDTDCFSQDEKPLFWDAIKDTDCKSSFAEGFPGCRLAQCGECMPDGTGTRCECSILTAEKREEGKEYVPAVKSCIQKNDNSCIKSECAKLGGMCLNKSILTNWNCGETEGLSEAIGVPESACGNCEFDCCIPKQEPSCGAENQPCCIYGCGFFNEGLSCCADNVCRKSCTAPSSAIERITKNEEGIITVYATLLDGTYVRVTIANDGKIISAESDGNIEDTAKDEREGKFKADENLKNNIKLPESVKAYAERNNVTRTDEKPKSAEKRSYQEQCSIDNEPKCDDSAGLVCVKKALYECDCMADFKWDDSAKKCIESEPEEVFDTCRFRNPTGIAVRSRDEIFVTDTGNNRIIVFKRPVETLDDEKPSFVKKYIFGNPDGSAGTIPGKEFNAPTGISVDQGDYNRVYVSDSNNNRVQVLNYCEPSKLYTFIKQESSAGGTQFSFPAGIEVYDENLFIADLKNNRIVVLGSSRDRTLEFIRQFGSHTESEFEEGKFRELSDITVYSNGIFAVDSQSRRIQVFDSQEYFSSGNFKLKGTIEFEESARIYAIATKGKYIYVSDSVNGKVYQIDSDDYSKRKSIDGLDTPTGLDVIDEPRDKGFSYLYISESGKNRILVYNTKSYFEEGITEPAAIIGPVIC